MRLCVQHTVITCWFSVVLLKYFLCGEGPRSRCYGRTAALRFNVQPCDEDEEKYDQFFHFSK
jgi:hypothetical protein